MRLRAGQPGYRELSRRAHYSATALAEAAGGQTLPSLTVTLAYVQACGGDPQVWETRYRALAEELTPDRPASDGPSPYLGLAAFQPDDADRYFGRDSLVEHLVHQVTRTPVVTVFGASGSGKSSLIRAGLIPATRSHPAFSGHQWSCVLVTPTGQPLRELARAVAELCGGEPDRGEPGWLDRALRHADPTGGTRVLLLVDQFEELFTLCPDAAERAEFVDVLLDAAQGPGRVAQVVLGVRADFYGHCATHPGLLEVLRQGAQVLVGPMTRDELRSAITQPAAMAGLTVERELVATMIADITDEPGGLPLLSHALLETWRHRRNNTMTRAGYQVCGGVHGALAQTAECLYADFDAAEQEVARQVFVRLIALGDGIGDTRRRVRHGELATVGDPAIVSRVLDKLAAARLVVIGTDSVEVAHEALIRAWPRLSRWLTDDRESVLLHRRITDATQVWQSSGRDPELLYRATQLDQVIAWAGPTHRAASLNADEREFLDAAIQLRDKQARLRKRRTLRLRVATAAVVALLATASVITLQQRSDARDQHRVAVARQLVAEATALRETDPLRAAQFSLAAWRIAPEVPASRDSLISTQAYPLPTRLRGHTGEVRDVAYSQDGRILATSAGDATVRLWDVATRTPIGAPLTGHTGIVNGLAFSPNGTILATASYDRTVRLWDVARRQPIGEPMTGHTSTVTGIAFSTNGRLLVTGGADGTVRTWDAVTRTAAGEPMVGHTGPITGIALSIDGVTAATSSNDKTVRLWNLATRAPAGAPLTGHTNVTNGVAFSRDGRLLASTSADKTVRLWDVATRTPVGAPLTGHTNVTYGVAFSADGRTLASSSWDKTVRIWDITSGRQQGSALTGSTSSVLNITFSPDGSALAGGDSDGTTLIWSLRGTLMPAHTDAVYAMTVSPDGRLLGTAADDRTARLWATTTREPLEAPLSGHTAEVRAMAFSPQGGILATGSWDGTLRLWDTVSHAPIGTPLTGHVDWVRGLTFSPDGRLVATAGMDMTVRLWDVATRLPSGAPLTGHTNSVTGIAFSPDGRTLATGANDKTVRLWDVTTRAPIGEPLAGHTSVVRDVVFSPDGTLLASAGDDKTIRLWDVAGRKLIATLTGHTGEVLKLAFSPDGHELASTSLDKTVRLWNTATRSTTTILSAGTGLAGVAYTPNGLMTGGVTGNVLLWTTDPARVADQVCAAIGADLSDQEWQRYVPTWPKPAICATK
ncbi:WD40 repeat domain-containing protein [Kibdelosporangium persicum]|uniref:WD40 repeat domain-containing protein n=1 Tax=Kibdelosporangium persicum TaxID=2698649 RepID=UPI00156438BB|nr:WD40 repeat domain-containing protein [Kibdelosporangium persicum]